MNVRLICYIPWSVVIKEQSSIKSNMDAIVYLTLLLSVDILHGPHTCREKHRNPKDCPKMGIYPGALASGPFALAKVSTLGGRLCLSYHIRGVI